MARRGTPVAVKVEVEEPATRWDMDAMINAVIKTAPKPEHSIKVRDWDHELADVLHGLLSDPGSDHSEGKRLGEIIIFAIAALVDRRL